MRIAGRNLPSDMAITYGLEKIKGIGLTRAKYIVQELSLQTNMKIKELSNQDVDRITKFIEDNFIVENDLQKEVSLNKKRKIDIRCYEGLRLQKGLPLKQRTKSNAKTARKGR